MARLLERYRNEIAPMLKEQLGYDNILAVPRLQKIVVSMGVGAAKKDKGILETAAQTLATITGQKPLVTRARKAVASFQLRRGMEIGLKVTLRGRRMYEFFDRLVNVAIPRIRDFRGLSLRGFDRFGNYSLGIPEQTVFPEVPVDKVERVLGMNVTICVRARRPSDSEALLRALGLPLRAGEAA